MRSTLWSNSNTPCSGGFRRAGFTLIELLLAMAITGVVVTIMVQVFSSVLQDKRGGDLRLGLQQNLRTAMQMMAQDLRSAAFLHVWNQSPCASGQPCSTNNQIAIVILDGTSTGVDAPPGNSFTNSAETRVCDASLFNVGDLGLLYNGSQVELLEITQRQTNDSVCGTVPIDKLQHNTSKISGQWTAEAQIFKAEIATYSLQPDPINPSRTVLFRRAGLSTGGPRTGIVAFDVTGLKVSYGIAVNLNTPASKLIFYNTLEDAASAANGSAVKPADCASFTANPSAANKGTKVCYVGSMVRAVRVTLDGQTAVPLPNSGVPGTFSLTETVELRR